MAGFKELIPLDTYLRHDVIGEKGEYWRSLCEQAAKEQDSNKLLELLREINQLLQG